MTRARALFLVVFTAVSAARCVDSSRDFLAQGDVALAEGRLADAAAAYSAAVRARPDSGVASFDLGYAYYRAGEFRRAEHAFRTAVKLLPRHDRASAFYNLGNALAKQGKLLEALSAYRSGLRLRPEDDDARYNYVLVESWLKRASRRAGGDGREELQEKRPLTREEAERLLDDLTSGVRALDPIGPPRPRLDR